MGWFDLITWNWVNCPVWYLGLCVDSGTSHDTDTARLVSFYVTGTHAQTGFRSVQSSANHLHDTCRIAAWSDDMWMRHLSCFLTPHSNDLDIVFCSFDYFSWSWQPIRPCRFSSVLLWVFQYRYFTKWVPYHDTHQCCVPQRFPVHIYS